MKLEELYLYYSYHLCIVSLTHLADHTGLCQVVRPVDNVENTEHAGEYNSKMPIKLVKSNTHEY